MKSFIAIGLVTCATLFAPPVLASTHQARCEINDGEALAWISATHDNIAIEAKAVMRVFDRQGDLLYKTSKRQSFRLDAYDTEKIYAIEVGRDAKWCELDLKDAEIAIHKYDPPTVIHHHYPAIYPTPSIVIYKKPRQETVIVERPRPPVRVYEGRRSHPVRVYENSRSRPERVIVSPPRSQTRVHIQLPPIRVKF